MDISWDSGLQHRLFVLVGSILACMLYYDAKSKGGFKDKLAEKKFVFLGIAIVASIIIGNCFVFNRWDANFILSTMYFKIPDEYAHIDFYFNRQSLVFGYIITIVWIVNAITNLLFSNKK